MSTMLIAYATYKSAENEENHEEAANRRLTSNIAIADSWHRDECEVDTFPVGRRVVFPFHLWKWVLHLRHIHAHSVVDIRD